MLNIRLHFISLPLFSVLLALIVPAHSSAVPNYSSYQTPDQAYYAGKKVCASPPQNFSFNKMSPLAIAYYGWPHRPSDASQLKRWEDIVLHAKHRTCKSGKPIPRFYNSTLIAPQDNVLDFTNWSGMDHYNTTSGGNRLESASSQYQLKCDSNRGKDQHSSWIGIGGRFSIYLWQGGWDAINKVFWWEYVYPGTQLSATPIISIKWSCNDMAYTYVDNRVTLSNSPYLLDEDYTTSSYAVSDYPNAYVDQESAEWIDERGACNFTKPYKLYNLSLYGAEYWSKASFSYTKATGLYPIDGADPYYDSINMVDLEKHTLSINSGVTGHDDYFDSNFNDKRTSSNPTDVQCP